MNILLTIFFENDIPLQAYYDHFYNWLCKNLPTANVKILMIEKYFNENGSLHIVDNLNPILLQNSEVYDIFNTEDFSEIYKKVHFVGLNEIENHKLSEIIKNKLNDWVPDITISQGYKSAYKLWAKVFPNTLCLNQENAIFSRPPFLRTLSYDPYNSVPDNFPVRFADKIKQFEITEEDNLKVEKLKRAITGIVDKYSKLDDEMIFYYKQKFDKLVLLPLVGDKYITLLKDCIYDTEQELVEKVMEKTPKNVGVFVTQADAYASLTPENIDYFSNKYPNFIYLKKTDKRGYANNSLNYFKYIDAVFNITSKTGYMAMLWDKPVLSLAKIYNNWYKDAQGLDELDKVLYTPYKNKNNILYWYFTRYVTFEQDFSKENFLYNYLQEKMKKYLNEGATFDFFEEINSIDKVLDYILKPVLSYYENIENEKNILFDTINKLQNEMNYVLVQTNDTVAQVNNAINNYVKQNDLNIIELHNRTDELSKKLEYITENQNKKIQNINSKLEYLLEKQNKPNFLQQIFSVKNEETHKVIRFLGLKIKIRRNKNG